VEALLRWQHPQLGDVSPAEFIPIAEDSGQILQIGEWVLRTALSQLKIWRATAFPGLTMAVNLSAIQFRQPQLPELVSRMLSEFQLPPDCLELELTEGVAVDDPHAAVSTMDQLHARGVRMSMDDFGTGYSSLSQLKRFQIFKLKIDQSFVRDLGNDTNDRAIVSAIIRMAQALGMRTTAEGVETAGQLSFLREQGCDEAQGYHFSKPLSAPELEAFMRRQLT
jgi:EAL domain-containing protein (putative c-di-GMP-specific phosphodiesterase class I)